MTDQTARGSASCSARLAWQVGWRARFGDPGPIRRRVTWRAGSARLARQVGWRAWASLREPSHDRSDGAWIGELLGSCSSASRLGEPGRAWASRAMTDQTARGSAIHAQSSPIHAPSDLTFTGRHGKA